MNYEQLAQTENFKEPSKSDLWDIPIITSSLRGKITWWNPQYRILKTGNETRAFARKKEIKEPAISDPSRLSVKKMAKDKPYTYAKAINVHTNLYMYAKSVQLEQKISHTCAQNPHNVHRSRTQTYSNFPIRTEKPHTNIFKIRKTYENPHTFAQTVWRRFLLIKNQSKKSCYAMKKKILTKQSWLDETNKKG